jgi:hypothetical protein
MMRTRRTLHLALVGGFAHPTGLRYTIESRNQGGIDA